MFGDIFSLVTTGRGSVVPGIYWVEAREAAMHSFWHRTVPPASKGLLLFSSSFMSDSATLQTVARQPMFIEFSRQEH